MVELETLGFWDGRRKGFAACSLTTVKSIMSLKVKVKEWFETCRNMMLIK